MTIGFKWHREEFSGFKVSSSAQAKIVSLRSEERVSARSVARPKTQKQIRVVATVELSNLVVLDLEPCARCGARAPEPDADALWHLMERHVGDRLAFPTPYLETFGALQDPDETVDHYPVPGWRYLIDSEEQEALYCAECVEKVHALLETPSK